MHRLSSFVLFTCAVLAGCEKPPLIQYPGDPPAAPSTQQNAAPVVDAGPDLTIDWPDARTQLAATATDDGLPSRSLQFSWRADSSEVEFNDAALLTPTVTFAMPGTYTLTFTATDGALQTSDQVRVRVKSTVYPAPDLSDADPDRGWMRIAPGEVGMRPEGLVDAQAYALRAGGAGLISRHGYVVHSWGNIDERFDVKSTTKSIGSIALGIFMDENRLRIDDRAVAHLPTFGTPPAWNDPTHLQAITLLQLATHTAGFEKTGGYGVLLAAPGTQWHYSDGGLNWLADTLTTLYADDLQNLFVSRVWPVLGINERDDIQWRRSTSGLRRDPRPNGIEHREFAAGMVANVNTLARVGLLFLRYGEWANAQRVVSPSFVELVRTPRAEAATAALAEPTEFPDAQHRYGVLWWTNATGALPNVPRDAFWAWGLGDSLIVVIPSLDLVIARAGPQQPATSRERTFGEADWNADYAVLAPFLDPIVQSIAPPGGPT